MKTFLLIGFLGLLSSISCQYRGGVNPKNAAILAEARYLSGDGSFGSAYKSDDGVEFKEETDTEGNRKGQYSYVDPDGKTITVKYTAGKNGFMVTGDHLPKAPLPVQPLPNPPQQQYTPRRQQQQQPINYNSQNYNSINNQQFNRVQQQQEQNVNGQFSYNFADQGQPQSQQLNNYNNGNFNNNYNNRFGDYQNFQTTTTTTTPSPSRFFPPGKLNLNRTPDGYQYSFTSN